MKKFHRKQIAHQVRVFNQCMGQAKPLHKLDYNKSERNDYYKYSFQEGYTPASAARACVGLSNGNKAKLLRSIDREMITDGSNRLWGNFYHFKAACYNFLMIRKGSPNRAR